jgi:hypothetical protein
MARKTSDPVLNLHKKSLRVRCPDDFAVRARTTTAVQIWTLSVKSSKKAKPLNIVKVFVHASPETLIYLS